MRPKPQGTGRGEGPAQPLSHSLTETLLGAEAAAVCFTLEPDGILKYFRRAWEMFLKSRPLVLKPSLPAGLRGIKASGEGDTVTVACAPHSTGPEQGAWHRQCRGLRVRSTILPAQPRPAPAPDKPLPGCWGPPGHGEAVGPLFHSSMVRGGTVHLDAA